MPIHILHPDINVTNAQTSNVGLNHISTYTNSPSDTVNHSAAETAVIPSSQIPGHYLKLGHNHFLSHP